MYVNHNYSAAVGERVLLLACLCVCLSVREHISGTAELIFTKFLCRSPAAVVRSSFDGVVIYYVLPVLWMTSRLTVVDRMAMRGCGRM